MAVGRQCGEGCKSGGVFGLVNVDIHIVLCGYVERRIHFKTVPNGYRETGKEHIQVGGAVGRAYLESLLSGVGFVG